MPIKILDLRESSAFGGTNSQLIRVFPGLNIGDENINILFGYLADNSDEWLLRHSYKIGLDLIKIPYQGPYDIGVIFRLAKLIEKNKIDIVHTHGYRGNVIVRSILDHKLSNFRTIITKHGIVKDRGLLIDLYTWIDKRPTRLADKVVAVDDETFSRMIGLGLRKQQLAKINNPSPLPNSFDISIFEKSNLKNELSIDDRSSILIYAGRLVRKKGIFDLLEAVYRLRTKRQNFILLIVGDGSSFNDLQAYSRKLNLQNNVKFLGMKDDITKYLAISSMLILPSYSEGSPMVILEAMAAKIPIIATRVGGIPSIISDNVSGSLFSPGIIDELVSKIEQIMDDKSYAKRIADNAILSLDRFSPYKIGVEYINLYKEIGYLKIK